MVNNVMLTEALRRF